MDTTDAGKLYIGSTCCVSFFKLHHIIQTQNCKDLEIRPTSNQMGGQKRESIWYLYVAKERQVELFARGSGLRLR